MTPAQLAEILGHAELPNTNAVARLLEMCRASDVRVSEGGSRREWLARIYATRLQLCRDDDREPFSSLVSSLANDGGDWVRILAVSTSHATGAVFLGEDGRVLAVFSRQRG